MRGNLCVWESSRHELSTLSVREGKQKACDGGWAVSGTIFLSYYIRRLKICNVQTSTQAYRMMHDCLPVGMEGSPQGVP